MSLKIGNVEIPFVSGFDLKQSYKPILARTVLRTKSGGGIIQSRWQKLQSTIQGSGWVPAALDGIDKTVAQSVYCVAPLSVYGATTSITIPRAFRTDADYTAQAAALVDGEIVATTLSIVGQVCTLGAVASATQYQVVYYPILSAVLDIDVDHDAAGQVTGWSITAQEL